MVLELFAGSLMALGIGMLVVLIVLVVSRYLLADARREIVRVRELHARLCGTEAGDSDGRI
ncbi:hypothetical protein [Pseudomonas gessardii]|uniref:hypothetical protein n=1 Tax=Pseudomonas gessardii TaxID=78544 RepID=UPI00147361F6|nr:hypothetical protein [Pseudomonas gessardii]NNA93384.1 hypothetical protein [Pseudomonas gessardii]